MAERLAMVGVDFAMHYSSRTRAFEVQLASSGRVITIAKEPTVTQALAAAGVEVQTACEQAANDQFTLCCSRAKTARLVLDL